MHVEELSNLFPISQDTLNAVQRVEDITGKSIRFEFVENLVSHAMLKAARIFMPEHIMYIKREKADCINHLIIHECHHIYRFWSVDSKDRKILSLSSAEGLSEKRYLQWKKEIGKKAEMFPPAIFQMWEKGLFTLFYNAVTDTRIETSIFSHYPSTISEQQKSLKGIQEEVRLSMGKEIEKMIPYSVFLHVGAMNYAFMTRLTPIIGKGWKKSFKGRTEITTLGNKLLRAIPEKDEGLLQDIEILNTWAEILGFQKDITWIDFEDVPFGYEHIL